ncbi:MAG: 50S ribosomal protein L1 [Desulfurococcales archaeon]|nr:50S ribosomal protein L1 [Desulfurococcales archaeon]MCE4626468.1 50S ribosomal protein L1 [Desulfurococcales archaeon]MCE4629693.1 50S ribosomal protein L1 [Desulfurococcales archaeon]
MSMDGKLVEAVSKALSLGKPRRFKQSVDLVIVLKDVDLRSPEGRIREIVYLPKKPTKEPEVCVVAQGDMEVKAKALGVTVLNREDLQKLRGNRKAVKKLAKKCDWVLVMAPLMGLAGGILGPALGPRGKAPTPVPPNADIEALINRFKTAVWVRTKNQPQIMVRVGTEDMKPEDIAENIKAVLSAVENKLGRQKIAKIYIKKTMGPPVQVLL